MNISRTVHHFVGFGSTVVAVATLAIALGAAVPAVADPDALWKIVHDECVPDQVKNHKPAPCEQVDLRHGVARGHVVLKDIEGATQFLIIPTAKVTGIESPELLRPDAPNYFASAWAVRGLVSERAHKTLPRDAVGLAVNSIAGRSQNQLHIHLDCLRADVRDDLRRHAGSISRRWSALGTAFLGHHYLAKRVDGANLRKSNPFKLLARGVKGARADMGRWTLVVAPVSYGKGHDGFVLLADRSDPASGDRGNGEELLDHVCALAGAPS